MEQLLRAIAQWWDSDDAPKEYLPGGMWLVEAPEDVLDSGAAYGVFFPVAGTSDNTTTSRIESPIIQFSLFSTSDESEESDNPVWKARDQLIASLDDNLLTMEASGENKPQRMFEMRRLDHGTLVKDPDEGYSIVLQYQVQYTTDK